MIPAALPSSLGEFRVEAILGEGGSGIVYDATWGPRKVALKVLHPSLADTDRVRAQFLIEAQRLQTIAHPAVVKVLAVGELPDGRPYLAMERLDGETLAQVLARGPLPLAQTLELFGELCSAVGTLHEQGLIHRDLKPENVFIVGGKHAVLLDFGIAKDIAAPASTTTMDGGVRGTPAYMAPERFFGQPASTATDIYELAVTLYAMLAGRLPWDDLADPEARLSPRPLVDLVSIPDELDVEIRRALSTRAQNRPSTAPALDAAVRAAAGASTPTQPADTARMRPAPSDPPPNKPTITAERKPWFAERQNTTDRGKTPLAWAPTAQAAPTPKKRWPIYAAALSLAAVGGGVAWWQLRDRSSPEAPTPAVSIAVPVKTLPPESDPWGAPARPTPSTPPLATFGPEISVAIAQSELAAALPHLPADTSFVIAALVGQMNRDERFISMFDKLGKHPKVQMAFGLMPPCVKTLISGSEWFAFGSTGFMADKQGTLIVRGRWQRSDVEACFSAQSQTFTMTDGAKLLQLPEIGWLDFLDANTVYISVRQDLAAAQVHDNVKKGVGLTKRARTLLATLPPNRALTFVVDGTGNVEWPGDPLPRGSDAAASVQISDWGVAFDVALDTHDEASARQLEAKVKPELEPLFASTTDSVGKLAVTRAKSNVRISGKLSTLMMGIVSSSIAAMP
ncbi:MAG: protein kinase [Deltaproteobacteria bacterium]|nr:protein kinase [Deltaproteobacteria bacterium]